MSNPLVSAEILLIKELRKPVSVPGLVERFLNVAKNDMHTLSSFEEKYELKWVEPFSEACNVLTTASIKEPMPCTLISSPVPVNDSLFETAIPVSCSAREDVKLEEVDLDMELTKEKLTEDELEFREQFKVILDKLTKQKLDILLDEVKCLEINNKILLEMVVDLLFEKAIKEPVFSKACAAISQNLLDNNPEHFGNFRRLVFCKCLNQFETWKTDKQEKLKKELGETIDSVTKKELQIIIDEEDEKDRMRAVANVRFIGELYKLKMLNSKIMDYCIKKLLEEFDEENLECLCQLLTNIGEEFENEDVYNLNAFFEKIQKIVDNKSMKISSRVTSMIQDVIDLRKKRWVNNSGAYSQLKTMDQIQIEIEKRARLIEMTNVYGMEGGSSKGDGNQRQISVMDKTYSQKNNSLNYSVNKLKLEAATQETLNYIKLPPISFEIIGKNMNKVLEKFQADPTSHRDMITAIQNTLTTYHSDSASIERSAFTSSGGYAPVAPLELLTNHQRKGVVKYTNHQRKSVVKYVIDQFLITQDKDELVAKVKQMFPPQYHAAIVGDILNLVLDKTVKEVNMITKSLFHLVATVTIAPDQFEAGLQETFELAPNLFNNIPMLYDCYGKILAPHIEKHITLGKIVDLCEDIITADQGHLLLKAIIKNLRQSMGTIFVKSKWQESGLQLSQWMCEEQVPEWIAKNNFDFLVGDSEGCDGLMNVAPVAPQEPLPDDKMKKAVESMIDLSLNGLDDKKLVAEVKKQFPPQYHAAFIGEFFNMTLVRSVSEINVITKLLFHLVATNTISSENFEAGLQETFEFLPDQFVDVYDMLGKILAPHIEKHITLRKIFDLSESVITANQGHLLLKAIIKNLNESMGQIFVKRKWQESGLQLSQWMSEEQVPDWIIDTKFEFLKGDSKASDGQMNRDKLTPSVPQEQLPDERMVKIIKSSIDLFLINPDDEKLAAEVKKQFAPQYHAAFIGTVLNMTLEKTVSEINVITMSLFHLVATNTISPENFEAGLQEILEFAPALFIDIPMVYDYLGRILAPHIEKHLITLRKVFDLCESIITADQGHLILKGIIKKLNLIMGPQFVKRIWKESGLQLSQWMGKEQELKWCGDMLLYQLVDLPRY